MRCSDDAEKPKNAPQVFPGFPIIKSARHCGKITIFKKKCAFYGHGFRSGGLFMYIYENLSKCNIGFSGHRSKPPNRQQWRWEAQIRRYIFQSRPTEKCSNSNGFLFWGLVKNNRPMFWVWMSIYQFRIRSGSQCFDPSPFLCCACDTCLLPPRCKEQLRARSKSRGKMASLPGRRSTPHHPQTKGGPSVHPKGALKQGSNLQKGTIANLENRWGSWGSQDSTPRLHEFCIIIQHSSFLCG